MKQTFNQFLKTTCMNDEDKKVFSHLLEYVNGKHPLKLSSRSCILCGDPGLGKTYLAERFIEEINFPVHYVGFTDTCLKNVTRHKDIEELDKNLKDENCIIFLDDLNTVLDMNNDNMEISQECRRPFMSILEKIKKSNNRMLFISTVNDTGILMDSIMNRIECRIWFSEPSIESKRLFLTEHYGDVLSKKQIDTITSLSIGYNFRDLPELVKLSFRLGNGAFSEKSIENGLSNHIPTNFYLYVQRVVKKNFNDVHGRDSVKDDLSRIIKMRKNITKNSTFFQTSNCLIFSGPPGTGKTLMAEAFAGENKMPFIVIRPDRFLVREGPVPIIRNAFKTAREQENCIIFVDEADKILGTNNELENETAIHAQLNTEIEGNYEKGLKSIIIFAVNNIGRFGESLRDRFNILEFDYPVDDERRKFIHHMLNSEIDEGIINSLTYATKGMAFREIRNVCGSILYNKSEGIRITDEYIQRKIKKTKLDDSLNMYG